MENVPSRRKIDEPSTFLVHLTRDFWGKTAKENLIDLICSRTIETRNSKGLFYNLENVKEQARTVCFNETTLSGIKHMIGSQSGRDIQLSSYGLVFSKDFLVQKGANPVLYINTYGSDERKRAIIDMVRSLDPQKQKEIAPYLDIFGWTGEGNKLYDFHWEHEWRHVGDFRFEWKDIIFGLCEDEYIDELEQLFEGEIRFISATMTLEEILGRLVINRIEEKYVSFLRSF